MSELVLELGNGLLRVLESYASHLNDCIKERPWKWGFLAPVVFGGVGVDIFDEGRRDDGGQHVKSVSSVVAVLDFEESEMEKEAAESKAFARVHRDLNGAEKNVTGVGRLDSERGNCWRKEGKKIEGFAERMELLKKW